MNHVNTLIFSFNPDCVTGFESRWRVAESKNKLLVVAYEPLSQIAAVDQSAYPHASNALAYLDGGGQDDIAEEIRKFI